MNLSTMTLGELESLTAQIKKEKEGRERQEQEKEYIQLCKNIYNRTSTLAECKKVEEIINKEKRRLNAIRPRELMSQEDRSYGCKRDNY